jgi:hypothetical protein
MQESKQTAQVVGSIVSLSSNTLTADEVNKRRLAKLIEIHDAHKQLAQHDEQAKERMREVNRGRKAIADKIKDLNKEFEEQSYLDDRLFDNVKV